MLRDSIAKRFSCDRCEDTYHPTQVICRCIHETIDYIFLNFIMRLLCARLRWMENVFGREKKMLEKLTVNLKIMSVLKMSNFPSFFAFFPSETEPAFENEISDAEICSSMHSAIHTLYYILRLATMTLPNVRTTTSKGNKIF